LGFDFDFYLFITYIPLYMDSEPKPPSASCVYPYLDRSFTIELALFMFFGPVLASLWFIVTFYYFYSGQISIPVLRSAIYFTITFLFARIFYGNVRTISQSKSVVIEDGKILKRSGRGITGFANCADVTGIRKLKIPFMKRWMALETQKELFLIPLGVRGGCGMVDRIFRDMQEQGSFLENAGAIRERLRDIARKINVLYDLRARNMPNLFKAATAAALLNCLASAHYWDRGLMFTLLYGILGMFLQISAYLAAEKLHLRKIIKNGDDNAGGRYLLFGLSALLLGMIAGILVTQPAG
jgi:hypothetical protein